MASSSGVLSLYLTRRDDLVSYAMRIVGDRTAAEDVVQDAYIRFGRVAQTRTIDDPLSYFYRIVRNLALDDRRRASVETRLMVESDAGSSASDQSPSPEAEMLAKDDLRQLTAALAELPERTRIALEMHRLGGCKLREIAAHLGISLTLAHELVVQGIEHCRRRLYTQP